MKSSFGFESFCRALLLAAAIHCVMLDCVALTFRGVREDYRIDFSFWGSILRKDELAVWRTRDEGAVGFDDGLLFEKSKKPFEQAWDHGVVVDKPEDTGIVSSVTEGPLPPKFSGPRASLAEEKSPPLSGADSDFPAAPNIRLRLPSHD
ncbi:MAG: hypothetical protein HQL16_00450 [Candidatus Omnitrophica bacterium]|nr:hypothetical protein [Candidatus Omnitrophota bacterium]